MDTTLIAAIIGFFATITAALIGVWISNKKSSSKSDRDPKIPYRLHKEEIREKEKEIRELLKAAALNNKDEVLSLEDKITVQKYNDNLTDYFEGVTENNKLHIEIAVTKDGKIAIFYDKTLKVQILQLELFVKEKGIVFVTAKKSRRNAGTSITQGMIDILLEKRPKKILLVLMHKNNKEALNGFYFPFEIYE